jgi:hypothetical protein
MQPRLLVTTAAAALLISTGASFAQDGLTSDSLVTISVEGTLVEVPVSLAARACGLEEAEIMASAFTEEMDEQEAGEETTVAPDPMETEADVTSSDGEAAANEATDTADATGAEAQPAGSEADASAPADVADEAATAAAAGEGATSEADTATTADNSADSATADEAAETVDGVEDAASAGVSGTAVCEIDQATAEQFAFPTGG